MTDPGLQQEAKGAWKNYKQMHRTVGAIPNAGLSQSDFNAGFAAAAESRDQQGPDFLDEMTLELVRELQAIIESRDQRIKDLEVEIQDLYDFGTERER